MTGRVGQAVVLELRNRLFAHCQALDVAFHESYTSGRVISRQTSDIDSISDLFEEGLDSLIAAILTLLLVGTGMLLLDWQLGLVVLAGFIPLTWLTRLVPARVGQRLPAHQGGHRAGHRAVRRDVRRDTGGAGVPPGAAELGDLLRAAARTTPRRAGTPRGCTRSSARASRWSATSSPAWSSATAGCWSSTATSRSACSPPSCSTCSASSTRCRTCRSSTTRSSRRPPAWRRSPACWSRSPRCPNPRPRPGCRSPRSAGGTRSGRRVRFEAVTFGYRDSLVLPGLELDIPAGQTVALVGETGAGKTTVARLLGRFYDPRSGRVTLDGIDLRQLPDAVLRAEVDRDHPGELPVRGVGRGQHQARPPGRVGRRGARRRPG